MQHDIHFRKGWYTCLRKISFFRDKGGLRPNDSLPFPKTGQKPRGSFTWPSKSADGSISPPNTSNQKGLPSSLKRRPYTALVQQIKVISVYIKHIILQR